MSLDYPVFGVGIRNSPLFALSYGADMEGRAIHNQYLQILCDSGYPALTLYLLMLALTWRSLRTVQRATRLREDDVGRDAYMVAVATECALAVFLVGSMFLSLELFELPYIFLLIGIQLPTALEIDDAAARADHPVVVVKRPPEPSFRPRTAPIALVRGSREGLLQ
jgi:O-antigen ligase